MLYSIVATKRSGHHAFIEWICSGLKGSYIYFNNCRVGDSGGLVSPVVVSNAIHLSKGLHDVSSTLDAYDFDNVIVSFENKGNLPFLESSKYRKSVSDLVEALSCEKVDVVFLRDFFNSFSSQFSLVEKHPDKHPQINSFINTWQELAGYFLNNDASPLCVSYNNFMLDSDYKKRISVALMLDDSPYKDELSYFGGGGNSMFEANAEFSPDKSFIEKRYLKFSESEGFRECLKGVDLGLVKEFSMEIGRVDLFNDPMKIFSSS